MSLTIGQAPFGRYRAGAFNFDVPEHVVFVDSHPRRVRAVKDGETVIDSDAVKMVHETGFLPHYAFPVGDVRVPSEPEPHAPGYVRVAWDSVDTWLEEDEEVRVHPRDPYHRIDTYATSRAVRISVDGETLAESTATMALYETGLPVRYYFPLDDVRRDLLEPSDTVTQCAYKGTARHWSARVGDALSPDVGWSYEEEVQREAEAVRGRVAFYTERVDLDVDGVRQDRPETPWSR